MAKDKKKAKKGEPSRVSLLERWQSDDAKDAGLHIVGKTPKKKKPSKKTK